MTHHIQQELFETWREEEHETFETQYRYISGEKTTTETPKKWRKKTKMMTSDGILFLICNMTWNFVQKDVQPFVQTCTPLCTPTCQLVRGCQELPTLPASPIVLKHSVATWAQAPLLPLSPPPRQLGGQYHLTPLRSFTLSQSVWSSEREWVCGSWGCPDCRSAILPTNCDSSTCCLSVGWVCCVLPLFLPALKEACSRVSLDSLRHVARRFSL